MESDERVRRPSDIAGRWSQTKMQRRRVRPEGLRKADPPEYLLRVADDDP